MNDKTKKRVNKTKEEMVQGLINKATSEAQDKRKTLIKERMKALAELEDKLGCVFIPATTYKQIGEGFIIGTENYIVPVDAAPKKETKEDSVV